MRGARHPSPLASYFEGTAVGGLSVNSLSVNRLLQKLAITVTHPFRRIRSFEDCLAERFEFEPSVPIVRSLK
jgi:hypothetical protein